MGFYEDQSTALSSPDGSPEPAADERFNWGDPSVDDGDWVWYDGHEWRADPLYDHAMLLRRIDPDDATQNIEEWGVDVRNLIPLDAVNCSDCGAFLPGRVDVGINGTQVLLSSESGRADVWCPECCAEIEHDYVSYALARSVVY
jgi:hypothetical protein